MVEKTPWLDRFTYFALVFGVIIIGFPIYYSLVAATHTFEDVTSVPMSLIPGSNLFVNLSEALSRTNLSRQLLNSFIMAAGITVGKIGISIISAFAMTYFNFAFRKVAFWCVFMTLMLPVEVRILPTYEVAANMLSPFQSIFQLVGLDFGLNFSLLNSYTGLIMPLVASATATFLFRQFFLTVPEELCEAAKIDGATPMQFFWKILFPLSKTNIAALTVIVFVFGWNQYLWPLLVTTAPEMKTAVVGIQALVPSPDEAPEWNITMAGGLLVMLPPVLVVILMQKYFVKGLIDQEK